MAGEGQIAVLKIVFNGEKLVEAMQAAQERLADPEPMHQEMGEYLVEAHRQRFIRGEAPDGTAWAPKSLVTMEQYRRRGDGDRPRPLIGPSGRLSREVLMFANASEVEVGSNLEYSGVMQEGAAKGAFGRDKHNRPIPWGRIPARVWLGLSDEDEAELIDIADGYLKGAFED